MLKSPSVTQKLDREYLKRMNVSFRIGALSLSTVLFARFYWGANSRERSHCIQARLCLRFATFSYNGLWFIVRRCLHRSFFTKCDAYTERFGVPEWKRNTQRHLLWQLGFLALPLYGNYGTYQIYDTSTLHFKHLMQLCFLNVFVNSIYLIVLVVI